MGLIQEPVALLTVLIGAAWLAHVLGRSGFGRKAGGAVIAVTLGALLANAHIIPPAGSGGTVYDPLMAVVTPAAIFLVLLEANLAALRRIGRPLLLAFGIGALGTAVGVFVAFFVTPAAQMLDEFAAPMAGMFAATYIGGSANFNAVALHYGVVSEGPLYTAGVLVDNVMTNVWVLASVLAPPVLHATRLFPRRSPIPLAPETIVESRVEPLEGASAILAPLVLATGAVAMTYSLLPLLASYGIGAPPILIVTTLALGAAQLAWVRRLTLAAPLGLAGIYLFLVVIGATADVSALLESGGVGIMLFVFVGVIFAVHAAFLLAAGLIFRFEPEILALASSANIGGSSTAIALAEAWGRPDLALPGVVAGLIGTAVGTYVGFAVTVALRAFGFQ